MHRIDGGCEVSDVLRLIWCVVISSINLTVLSNPSLCFDFVPKQIQVPVMLFSTSRNTNEDVSSSDYDPSIPSSTHISYLHKAISSNVAYIHVTFKSSSSLRVSRLVMYETFSRIQLSKLILYHFGLEPRLKLPRATVCTYERRYR